MNIAALQHNAQVVNDFGPKKFNVHHDGIVTVWGAHNRKHLDLLLRMEKNYKRIENFEFIDERTGR